MTNGQQMLAGFSDTFESRFVEANGIRQHMVMGGDGPPLLLTHGWPEDSYAWRSVMQPLAQDYTVTAVDQCGIGLTDSYRVERLVVAEVPGPPGITKDGPPLFLNEADNNRLWHIPFNRVNDELNVNLAGGNAEEFYRYEFNVQAEGNAAGPGDQALRRALQPQQGHPVR